MAVALPVFFISPLAGWLCDRWGPKIPAAGGLLASVPALVLLRLPHSSLENQPTQVVVLCVILALLGMSYPIARLIVQVRRKRSLSRLRCLRSRSSRERMAVTTVRRMDYLMSPSALGFSSARSGVGTSLSGQDGMSW
jgi:MFS family permease